MSIWNPRYLENGDPNQICVLSAELNVDLFFVVNADCSCPKVKMGRNSGHQSY